MSNRIQVLPGPPGGAGVSPHATRAAAIGEHRLDPAPAPFNPPRPSSRQHEILSYSAGFSELTTTIRWPEGKKFAFTIFDDTDHTTLENGPIVYDFLYSLGIITTKSVWPIAGTDQPRIGGTTCADPDYRAWVASLQERGFEIALHNVTYHGSRREEIRAGLDRFHDYFGHDPRAHANHVDCEDSVYWGPDRLSGGHRLAYHFLTRFRRAGRFGGTDPQSPHYWGDLLHDRVEYVRNFVFSDINTLRLCPEMPYVDPQRPLVRQWFAATDGGRCESFCRVLSEANQDRLEREGGACIMYTHLGEPGFWQGGRLSPRFVELMVRLSRKDGWFVPVSVLLDHIRAQRGDHCITPRSRKRLERRWLFEKMFVSRGTT